MRVEDGHLLAYEYTDELVASWAPGMWRRFWARPSDEDLTSLKNSRAALEHIRDTAVEGTPEWAGLEWMIESRQARIAEMESLMPVEGAA